VGVIHSEIPVLLSLKGKFPPAILALADGTVFLGNSIGATGATTGEVVFNTAMTGYQEILTDPSYARQIVTLTYPHIGNTGCTTLDDESAQAWAAGLVVRDVPRRPSSWRSEGSLPEWLRARGIVAIADIDTRKLDAPSGTALTLGAAAQRAGAQPRHASIRAGDIVGEHMVQFATAGERIELVHRAGSRDIFARGALHAALALAGRPAGLRRLRDLL
jgi:carbamoyl-phosphate synthase small subunit